MKKLLLIIALLTVSCSEPTKTTEADTRVIKDGIGREVSIPKEVKRLITIDRGFSPQVLKVLDKDDLLVATGGVHPKSGPYSTSTSDSFFLAPSILEIPTVGWAGYGSYDFEKILEVNPEVISIVFYDNLNDNGYQQELLTRLEEEFKIPVVVLRDYRNEAGLQSLETYYENIELLGTVVNADKEAKELINKLRKQIEIAQSFIKENDEKMIFLGVTDAKTGAGYVHGQDFSGAALTTSLLKINNVLTEADMPILGTESILEFNPDIIAMLDSPASSTAVELYTKNELFQNITAVKNGRVYFMGQLQWWGDAKLMFPLQLVLFSAINYLPENESFRGLYANYMTEIFGLSEDKIDELATIHRLDYLFEQK